MQILVKKLFLDGGGGTLVALSLAVFGGLVFSPSNVSKAGNGIPILRNTYGFLGKRSHSNVSGGITSPIPSKRQRVQISTGGSGDVPQLSPDDWVLRTRVGSGGEIVVSSEQPTYIGISGHNLIYNVTSPGGGGNYVFIPMVGSTGWYQRKDIIWTNGNN